MMAAPRRRRDPAGLPRIRQACDRLHARGREVTVRAVAAELGLAEYFPSLRDVYPVVEKWKSAMLERCSGRIDAAANALLVLETDLERDAVRRAVEARTGGGVRVKFVVKRRIKRKATPPAAAAPQGGAK